MLSPVFTSSQSRQIANHAAVGIEAYGHWRKALATFLLFLSWLFLSAVFLVFTTNAIATIILLAVTAIVLLITTAVTYIIFDKAISPNVPQGHSSPWGSPKTIAKLAVFFAMLYIGFLMFILPGVILTFLFCYAPAYITRGHSLRESLRKSKELTQSTEAPSSQAMVFIALIGVFVPPIMFLIAIMPMMAGVGASVAETYPISRGTLRPTDTTAPIIKSHFERKKD